MSHSMFFYIHICHTAASICPTNQLHEQNKLRENQSDTDKEVVRLSLAKPVWARLTPLTTFVTDFVWGIQFDTATCTDVGQRVDIGRCQSVMPSRCQECISQVCLRPSMLSGPVSPTRRSGMPGHKLGSSYTRHKST